jgi:membrane protease YdiL (CAAX protease family)
MLAFALVFPTLLTWIYFVALADTPSGTQQVIYSLGKMLQFGLPLLWFAKTIGRLPRWRAPRARDLGQGLLIGGIVTGLGLAFVYGWLAPADLLDSAQTAAAERAASFGLSTPAALVALGLFYSLVHAFLEEAYWRGFAFGQLGRRLNSPAVVHIVAALAFAAHHVVLLAVFFGLGSPLTWLLAASVAFGGLIWSTQYQRSGSLWGPWIGHALVDAGIFAVGYDWLF